MQSIFDVLFHSHPLPLWVCDPRTGHILDANRAAEQALGRPRDEMVGLTANALFSASQPASGRQPAGQPEDLSKTGPWQLRGTDGAPWGDDLRLEPVEWQGRAALLVSATGDPRPGPSSIDRLRQSEAGLREAQRIGNIGSWQLDLETGQLDWSDQVYAIAGVRRDAFPGDFDAFFHQIHPEDRDQLSRARDAALAGLHPMDVTFRLRRPDGTIRVVREVAQPVDGAGGGRYFAGVIQDITELHAARSRAEQADRLLRMAGHAVRLGGWRVNLVEGTVFWTDEVAAIHDEPPGTHPTYEGGISYFAPEYRDEARAVFRDCAERGIPFDNVRRLITAKGQEIWVRSLGEAVRDGAGRIVAVQGALQDITELVEARKAAERLSERLVRTFESISDGFFTLDRDWRITLINDEGARILERDRADLVGRTIWDCFPGTVGSPFWVHYHHAMASGQTVRALENSRVLGKWIDISIFPSDEGLSVYFRDVTARRAADEQLRLLETAVSRQNDVLIITDASTLQAAREAPILYVNDAFTRLTGYAAAEVIGQSPRLLQGPRTQPDQIARIRAAIEEAESVRAELINYTKDGREFWQELNITPIFDANGALTHFVAVQRDITERKLAEGELRLQEERFRLAARATSDVIWDADLVRNRAFWSEAMTTVFGHAVPSAGDASDIWLDHVHPDDRARVEAGFQAAIDSGASRWQDEYRFLRANGEVATVLDRGFVLRDDAGKPLRVIGSMSDITERRQFEDRLRQSQRLEAVGQLTGGVAHDFNNLLTVILGNAELLGEQLAGDRALLPLTEMIAQAAERGADLTRRLLAFARRQPLEARSVDVNALIQSMDGLLRRTLPSSITLQSDLLVGLWPARVDPGQLENALLNLVLNSRDAMPNGGRLSIVTENVLLDARDAARTGATRPGRYIQLDVTDTGTGMTREVAERAFDPFYTTKDVNKGSGLGLSMVYGFVTQSGGAAAIDTGPGQGTTVRLFLPAADSRPDAPPRPDRTVEVVPGGVEHVLVVEDNPDLRDHVRGSLRALGYRVTAAASGQEALTRLAELGDVDLLFTDVVMAGGMNGVHLCEAARVRHPGLKVLLSSGYSEWTNRGDTPAPLLKKPYRQHDLAVAVRRALDG